MKYIFVLFTFTLVLLNYAVAQQNNNKIFPTAESAANKAKSDMVELLRTNRSINLGVDSAAITRAQPATPIRQFQLTFEQLASFNSRLEASNTQGDEKATVVPLAIDNKIVTTVEVVRIENGWKVASLGNKEITDELNAIRASAGNNAKSETVIYNLPHTAYKVYAVGTTTDKTFHTNYPGFNIRRGASENSLFSVIKQEASDFQKKYANDLKNRKLVQ